MDLYHYAVPSLKRVQHILERQNDMRGLVWDERFGKLGAVSEPAPDHFAPYHHLIATHVDAVG